MKLSEKQDIVQELHEKFARSKIVVLTDYVGMNVAALSALRRRLKEANIDYKVAKNTLLARASEGTYVETIKKNFNGPTGIALSYDDPVAPAKILTQFAKENDKLEIKGGAMIGKVLDLQAIKALSSLPSREVLLGQVLSAMIAVPTTFVRVLNGVPQKLLFALQAIKEKKQTA